MILPASVPIDDPTCAAELTHISRITGGRSSRGTWMGRHSLPFRLDRENPNLGRYSASRRVARTLFLGSAPTLHTANKGLDDRAIKLGCVQPGETRGDLRRRPAAADRPGHPPLRRRHSATGSRPSRRVNRLAQDRAGQLDRTSCRGDPRTARKEASTRGRLRPGPRLPASSGDVPDEREAAARHPRPRAVHFAKAAATARPARRPRPSSTSAAPAPACTATPSSSSPPTRPAWSSWTQPSASISPGSRSRPNGNPEPRRLPGQPGRDPARRRRRDVKPASPRPTTGSSSPASPTQGSRRVGGNPPPGSGRPGRPRLKRLRNDELLITKFGGTPPDGAGPHPPLAWRPRLRQATRRGLRPVSLPAPPQGHRRPAGRHPRGPRHS